MRKNFGVMLTKTYIFFIQIYEFFSPQTDSRTRLPHLLLQFEIINSYLQARSRIFRCQHSFWSDINNLRVFLQLVFSSFHSIISNIGKRILHLNQLLCSTNQLLGFTQENLFSSLEYLNYSLLGERTCMQNSITKKNPLKDVNFRQENLQVFV